MTTPPVMSVTDEFIAELEAAANAATVGKWCTDGGRQVMSAESDQLNSGFVIVDCQGPDNLKNAAFVATASPSTIRALLSERAELKRDAERYRLFAATVAAEFAGLPLTGSQKALFDAMNSREEVSGVDDVGAMFDAAMTP